MEFFMKNKNEIIEDIKVLKKGNPNEFKGLKKELTEYIAHLSTDEDSDHSVEKSFSKIKQEEEPRAEIKEYLKPLDKYHNSQLNFDIQEQNFEQIKSTFNFQDEGEVNILRKLSFFLLDEKYRIEYDINKDMVTSILGDAIHKLELLGENVTDIVENDNLS